VTDAPPLIERDDVLAGLHRSLASARDRRGGLALVTGEAGAGKTSVVREFIRRAAGRPVVLQGACDPLSAPRPLGPLLDAAAGVDVGIAQRLAAGVTRAEAFATALELVAGNGADGRATVFVVEDAHWADDATLDLLTFLGRRITALPTLLVVTYRDDEVGGDHPLRLRLGELATAVRSRSWLAPLSADGIAVLTAGTDLDPIAVHRLTGGNAFYVTEVLAAGASSVPESIRDAVLARAGRLTVDARAVLDACAVFPGRVERWLIDAVGDDGEDDAGGSAGLDECIERGLVNVDASGTIAFRHELARHAIDEGLPRGRRRELHARALGALLRRGAAVSDRARLAFHAAAAHDAVAVLEHAPVAAVEASAVGAHREAARHLEIALQYEHHLAPRRVAELLLLLGDELMLTGRPEDAVRVCDRAVAIFASVGDVEGRAEAQIRTIRPLVTLGRQPEADARVEHAAALLAERPPSRAAALVATYRCSNDMLARRFEAAEVEGQRAIALAEHVGERAVLTEAWIQSGVGLSMSGDDSGLARVRRGISIAAEFGNDLLVAVGHSQIGSGYGELRRYDVAVPALREGIAFAEARELFLSVQYQQAWLGRCRLELGEWDEAGDIAGRLLRNPRCVGISRFVALVTLGWLRGRRGDPEVRPLLDEAVELARSTRHLQRLWPVAACRAEIAWLADRLDDERELIAEAAALAHELDYPPAIEELAYWQQKAGEATAGAPERPRTPFGLAVAGRHDLAAARWAELGCPYEEAVMRLACGDPDGLLAAHRTFDRLGAIPMRGRAATALRDAGIPIPRGPTPTSRANPHELTERELDVLALVATGRTNREIGEHLGITAKTVDHHVSRVLSKLDVRSRAEAAVVAERLGLTAP
jgi:DNA-binding CsgD family transcriptional regulator/tetratricopeptide (TPR) repeat protein